MCMSVYVLYECEVIICDHIIFCSMTNQVVYLQGHQHLN